MKKLTHIPPTIQTQRLYLRPFTISDASLVLEWNDHDMPIKTMRQAREYLKKIMNYKDGYFLGIFTKENDKLVGDLELCHLSWYRDTAGEICYGIHPAHRGKGYATEATAGLVDYLFRKVKLHKITADTNPENIASQKVLEKLGFTLEGIAREKHYEKKDDKWVNENNYGILANEWFSRYRKPIYRLGLPANTKKK